mmetsp:Transcript_28932/g.48043  ORF Transcript_28932/g.48043 Transcript_28932/m.48043 type:complete len:231 (+) Transcript_28932:175-867(+)|eukprot:CAMPEP_0119318902 /NCGR_PEP_ID=MMETSP1333-20130426/47974_1 /TAXON_ID=418940 /ORGANISM="Scyphosphaera apsteinii, Strain RCC1455" /LENGTH=230 /DNA_ID=CAMNT_0007325213 /DNA_START=171 /DNA_END=863 /DNA_ORIENTATION=+
MKPDWDTLAEEFKDSKSLLIASVDCTAEGKPLCSRFNVEGFPTLKSFEPPNTEGEEYEGGRELDELRAHAKSLGPGCSPITKDKCSTDDLAELEALSDLQADELEAEITELKRKIAVASEAHEQLVMSLRAQFEKSEQSVKDLKRTGAARLKLLRAAYGGDYPPCDDDPSFKDKDGEGCASFRVKPVFSCGHEGYEEACTRCCATCSSTPNCKRLAAKAPGIKEVPKDEV